MRHRLADEMPGADTLLGLAGRDGGSRILGSARVTVACIDAPGRGG